MAVFYLFKETVSHDFLPLFCLKIVCPCSCCLYGPASFYLDMEVFIFLNCCFWVCKHTHNLFCLIFPLKSMRSLQSFSESVRVVNNNPYDKYCFCIVNDYGGIMSVQSMTTWTQKFVTFIVSFFFFQSKIIYHVSAQSLTTLTRVHIVIDYSNTVSAQYADTI